MNNKWWELPVTPELVDLVKKSGCQSCGAYPYEDCQRHPQRKCYREFCGGLRNLDNKKAPEE